METANPTFPMWTILYYVVVLFLVIEVFYIGWCAGQVKNLLTRIDTRLATKLAIPDIYDKASGLNPNDISSFSEHRPTK